MGLQTELGYQLKPTNTVRRAIQGLFATPVGGRVGSRLLPIVDNPIFRLTGGRHTATSLVGGLPVIMLTTVGRTSGHLRTVPLLAVASGDDLAVIGSNFGQRNTPGWVHNLLANPAATVGYRDQAVNVTARRADPAEVEAAFAAGAQVYSGYSHYRERAAHRVIEVFVLEPQV